MECLRVLYLANLCLLTTYLLHGVKKHSTQTHHILICHYIDCQNIHSDKSDIFKTLFIYNRYISIFSPLALFGMELHQVDQTAEVVIQAKSMRNSISACAAKANEIQAVKCCQNTWIIAIFKLCPVQLSNTLVCM